MYARRSMAVQSHASVPPAPACRVTIASASAYSPAKRSEVRACWKSCSTWALFCETSARSASSPSEVASSKSSPRSRAAVVSCCQRVISSRRPSASRASRRAVRWSSQKPGASICVSISARRAPFTAGSKTPRRCLDTSEQVAQAGGVDAHRGRSLGRTKATTGFCCFTFAIVAGAMPRGTS